MIMKVKRKMKNYRLIALDMDGTLLNSQLKITSETKEAIARAHAAGKHVVLSTGRCISELREILAELPQVRYLVCENGCCVYDCETGRTLHCDPVPEEEVRNILRVLEGERVVRQVFSENQSYINQQDDSWMEACLMDRYRETFKKSAVLDPFLFERYEKERFRIEKVNLYFESDEDRERVCQKLAGRPIQAISTMVYLLECFSKDADKGRGLEKLCEHLSISMDEVIAVGDGRNDLEMLSVAGLSVAMGNAEDFVKDAANTVTDDCDHDGVAKVIRQYLL